MPDLTRTFCICGQELDNPTEPCPVCHVEYSITFDPELLTKPKIRRAKAHPSTCECDICEALSSDRRELDFSYD